MKPAISRSCTTSRRACSSTWRGASPRIATTSASPSTAPSFSACPARPGRPSTETIHFANEINPHTIQVSLAAPYPGTELYREALEHGWLDDSTCRAGRRAGRADRAAALPASDPHRDLPVGRGVSTGASTSARRKIAAIVSEMVRSPEMMVRRLREGVEFFSFLRERRESAFTEPAGHHGGRFRPQRAGQRRRRRGAPARHI